MLYKTDHTPFANGVLQYHFAPSQPNDPNHRIFLPVTIQGIETSAVLDTGAPFLIIEPRLASDLGLQPSDGFETAPIGIRGHSFKGTLHRIQIEFTPIAGEGCREEVTVFAPNPDQQAPWESNRLPYFLGFEHCIDHFRFAIDPAEQLFYFSSTTD